MLAKKYRLPMKEGERFSGKRRVSRGFVVVGRPNMKPHKRVAFIVSKKLYKLAVDRNRLKRQLRHAVMEVVKEGSGDYLVIARPGVRRLDYDEMKAELGTMLNHL